MLVATHAYGLPRPHSIHSGHEEVLMHQRHTGIFLQLVIKNLHMEDTSPLVWYPPGPRSLVSPRIPCTKGVSNSISCISANFLCPMTAQDIIRHANPRRLGPSMRNLYTVTLQPLQARAGDNHFFRILLSTVEECVLLLVLPTAHVPGRSKNFEPGRSEFSVQSSEVFLQSILKDAGLCFR